MAIQKVVIKEVIGNLKSINVFLKVKHSNCDNGYYTFKVRLHFAN